MKMRMNSKSLAVGISIALAIGVGIGSVPVLANRQVIPEAGGWTQVVNDEDVDILACRKGNSLRDGFKLLGYRHRFAVRKIQINVIYNNSSHWLGKYEAWNEVRSYSYNSSVPNRHVTLMVKKRDGSNLLFSGFVYNELVRC